MQNLRKQDKVSKEAFSARIMWNCAWGMKFLLLFFVPDIWRENKANRVHEKADYGKMWLECLKAQITFSLLHRKKTNISETEICSVFFFFSWGIILLKAIISSFVILMYLVGLVNHGQRLCSTNQKAFNEDYSWVVQEGRRAIALSCMNVSQIHEWFDSPGTQISLRVCSMTNTT